MIAVLAKRAFWPLLLLLLPPAFYLYSMHSGGTPDLRPGAVLRRLLQRALRTLDPAAAGGGGGGAGGGLSAADARQGRGGGDSGGHGPLADPSAARKTGSCFKKAISNYQGHRELEREVEDYLRPRYVRGSGIVTEFGATTAIYRELGIPLRETLTGDNGAVWAAAQRGRTRSSTRRGPW